MFINAYCGGALVFDTLTQGVDADAPPGPGLPVSSTVYLTYSTSNGLPDDLSGIEVTDDQGVVVTCPATTLVSGESMECTASATVTQDQYANFGTITALLPDTTVVNTQDPSHHFGQHQARAPCTRNPNPDTRFVVCLSKRTGTRA